MGTMLSEGARVMLTDIVSRELLRNAQGSIELIHQEALTIEYALRTFAGETQQIVEKPSEKELKIYLAEDFLDPSAAPADLTTPETYAQIGESGKKIPIPVSFSSPVFFLADGVDRETVAQALKKLSQLQPTLESLFFELAPIIFRVYVGFENGIHISFPGHGNYPANFDPRHRPWYIRAAESGQLVWQSARDASTDQVIFTVSIPVNRTDGSLAGVAAMDLTLTEVMKINQLHSQWSSDTAVFLVTPERQPTTDSFGLKVLAQRENGDTYTEVWLTSADTRAFETLVRDIRAGRSGVIEIPYNGVDSIWAFAHKEGPAESPLCFLVIVPKSVISAIPDRVSDQVLIVTREFYLLVIIGALCVLFLAVIVAFFGARAALRPLMTLIDAWKRLGRGDFSVRIAKHTGDERSVLSHAFNEMVPRLESQFEMTRSLELAREVQRNLLPEVPPEIRGIDIAGSSRYCDETGGDYFDIFRISDEQPDRVVIMVGDVSGHGVGSALLMATARAHLRALSVIEEDLAHRIRLLNRLLSADTADSGNFVTLFCLELDCGAGRIQWVRAGHDPALLLDAETGEFEELSGEGAALGIDESIEYHCSKRRFDRPGQTIFIGTDGIWEAHNDRGEMFGKSRFAGILERHRNESAKAILNAVFTHIDEFRGTAKQEDDITMVVIKRTGQVVDGDAILPSNPTTRGTDS